MSQYDRLRAAYAEILDGLSSPEVTPKVSLDATQLQILTQSAIHLLDEVESLRGEVATEQGGRVRDLQSHVETLQYVMSAHYFHTDAMAAAKVLCDASLLDDREIVTEAAIVLQSWIDLGEIFHDKNNPFILPGEDK